MKRSLNIGFFFKFAGVLYGLLVNDFKDNRKKQGDYIVKKDE